VIEARSDRLIYFAANAMTREQYALPIVEKRAGIGESRRRPGTRNSPVEQPGDEPGRDGATISAPMSGPTVGL
jgi:hypothetical protein